MGQSLVMWGFFSGHFAVWSIGNLFSIGGVTFSMLSVVEAFKHYEARLESLANITVSAKRKPPVTQRSRASREAHAD